MVTSNAGSIGDDQTVGLSCDEFDELQEGRAGRSFSRCRKAGV